MDKGLTVPKWMLIVWQKIPQMKCPRTYLPNVSAQDQNIWISKKKSLLGVRNPWFPPLHNGVDSILEGIFYFHSST